MGKICEAYCKLLKQLHASGLKPKKHILDNEVVEYFMEAIKRNQIEYASVGQASATNGDDTQYDKNNKYSTKNINICIHAWSNDSNKMPLVLMGCAVLTQNEP